jgi:hypothetical protein
MDPKAQRVIDACFNDWDSNKSDCNAFVKAVASDLGISIPDTNANGIVDFLSSSPDWTALASGNGTQAKAEADGGKLVIGGLRGNELVPPQGNGHVLVVMSGPLDPTHNQYPRAAWGKLGSVGEKDSFVNFSFNATDRDDVHYLSRPLP